MKYPTILAIILSAAMAAAETKITEFPDHILVELIGTPQEKPAATMAGGSSHAADDDGTAEQRTYLAKEMQRLQKERQELMKKQEWDPPDEVRRKQEEAREKQKELSRITAELAKSRGQKTGQGR
ncbi:MAG: hypothetical protein NDI77_08590 [Geobacteraceae bacterium]|nr:hypothetical protein [Geobacteraceae bacterium]